LDKEPSSKNYLKRHTITIDTEKYDFKMSVWDKIK